MESLNKEVKLEKDINDYKERNYELCKKIEDIQDELNDLNEKTDSDVFEKKLKELEKRIIEINNLHNFAHENQIALYPSSHDISIKNINSNLIEQINKIVNKKEEKQKNKENDDKAGDNSLSVLLTFLSRNQLIDLKDYIMISQYEGYVDEYYFEKGMPNDKYHFKNLQKMNYLQSIIDCYKSFFENIAMEIRKR